MSLWSRVNPWMLGTVLTWGFNFLALKLLYLQISAPSVGLLRFILMFVTMQLICLATGTSARYPSRKETLPILGLGMLTMGVYMVFFLEGMKHAGPAEGAILISTAPIFTSLFAALSGEEKWNWGAALGALVAIGGVSMVVQPSLGTSKTTPTGIILLVIAAGIWGIAAVWTKKLSLDRSPLQLLTLSMPGALPLLLVYAYPSVLHIPWGELTATTWFSLLHMALLAGALGFFGFNHGVKQVGSSRAMAYQFFVPPTAMFSAWLAYGTVPKPLQYLGLLTVIAGVWLTVSSRRTR